jgi:FKBP-type peptidyl-prolyl cis-trans isomerase SlyD
MQISQYKAVILNYTLRNEAGEVIDSSDVGGPLSYIHGTETLIPGLENALDGRQQGERLSVTVRSEDAYGERNAQMVDRVPRENFPGIDDIQPGMQFQTEMEGGYPMVVTVTEVDENFVTVDGNHPLAGRDLDFDIEVIEVRDASSEELEHGHVHLEGDGCSHD